MCGETMGCGYRNPGAEGRGYLDVVAAVCVVGVFVVLVVIEELLFVGVATVVDRGECGSERSSTWLSMEDNISATLPETIVDGGAIS
jgi:hypothetical protein